MNKTATLLLCCIYTFLSLSELSAQSFLGVQFNYMQPLDEYGENITSSPRGLGVSFQFKPQLFKYLYFGVQTGVSMYATDSYHESVKIDDIYQDVDVDEEDCFVSYNVTGRFYILEERLLNPYIEARLGGLSFFSTKLTDEKYDEYIENSTSFHGTAFQAGIGAGFSYHVVDNLWIDLNVMYNKGSHTSYRDIGSKEELYRIDPAASKFESYTGNINYSLGVQFGF